jgi:predicted nucleic acid-binding protein
VPAKSGPTHTIAAVAAAPDRSGDVNERLLLDCSIWVAAVFGDEKFHAESRYLTRSAPQSAAALDLTFYEAANVLKRRGRPPADSFAMARIIRNRTAGRIVRVDPDLIEFIARDAAGHDLTAYDAAYVTVARLNNWTLVSADHRDLVSKGLAVAPDAAV